jgi:hypothetical protein
MTEPRTLGGRTVRIFQIFYDDASRAALDPAFIPLDNSSNERPDWAEYWPIRRFLLAGAFDDDELLGFLSPRFGQKTGMTGRDVLAAIEATQADVWSFSPHLDVMALNSNPFRQGDTAHPGLLRAMTALEPRLRVKVDINRVLCDRTTTIYANYWVGPGRLWREWLAMGEAVFALCEAGTDPLARVLNGSTVHRQTDGYPMKVFVIERLVTLLLEARGLRAAWCLDPRRTAPEPIWPLIDAMLVADDLKTALRREPDHALLARYEQLRGALYETILEIADLASGQVRAPGA